jgi:hypothetical protein
MTFPKQYVRTVYRIMKAIADSFKNITNIFKHPKLNTLLVSVVVFSLVYTLLDDEHFNGVNVVKEQIKEDAIKKKLDITTGERNVRANENFVGYVNKSEDFLGMMKKAKVEKTIDEAKKEVEKTVEEEELQPENIDIPITQRMFDRTYFSFTTATLLGYGDIYPVTNICKIIVMLQAFITVGLIVF